MNLLYWLHAVNDLSRVMFVMNSADFMLNLLLVRGFVVTCEGLLGTD